MYDWDRRSKPEEPRRGAHPQGARLLPTARFSQAEVREIQGGCTFVHVRHRWQARETEGASRPLPADSSVRTTRVGRPTSAPACCTSPGPRGRRTAPSAACTRILARTRKYRALIRVLRCVRHLIVSIKFANPEVARMHIIGDHTDVSKSSGRGNEKELCRALKHDRILRAAGKIEKHDKTCVTKLKTWRPPRRGPHAGRPRRV